MSLAVWLGIGLLGGVGAIARFLADAEIGGRATSRLPVGTLAVNLSGAFALGVLVGATADADAIHLAATGLLGSYTTFSTWMYESERLGEDGELVPALVNLVLSLALGVGLAWLGLEFGRSL
jgi:fluoride exporter